MKPLMYIVQPDNEDIQIDMQSYVVKKVKPKVVNKPKKKEINRETEIEEAKVPIEAEVVSSAVAIQEEQVEEEPTVKQYRKQRKPITQMNVEEKIEFFNNLPKNMPRTLCQIETFEETYRGVIMSEENNIVTIRSLTHAKPIDIPINQIKAINLLGF